MDADKIVNMATESLIDSAIEGCNELAAERDRLKHELALARESAEDLQSNFDLRWNCDMRAIKAWQAAHPGNDLVWPDHADLCMWLLEELAALKEKP